MNKVWSFGCSHVRGTELGVSKYFDTDKFMMDRIGCTDIFATTESKRKKLENEWDLIIKNLWDTTDLLQKEKELSFSGQVAKKLGYDLHNHGIRGAGADRTFRELLNNADNIDWNNDIVFVAFTFTHRFMYDETKYDGNRNINYSAGKSAEVKKYIQLSHLHGPTNFSWSAWNSGIYFQIKHMFPKVYFIDIDSRTNSCYPGQQLSLIRSNTKRLQDFAKYAIIDNNYVYDTYPQYHFKEYAHAAFSDYLIEELKL